ncbi:hypothetical protein QFZ23_002361 [Arthrobacter globiformis]|nr:hypothetical protein [Arthrobacter globiformis]
MQSLTTSAPKPACSYPANASGKNIDKVHCLGQAPLGDYSAELVVQRAGSHVPKTVLARDDGINRETLYQNLRHTQRDESLTCRRGTVRFSVDPRLAFS